MVKDKFNARITIMSGANVSYINRNYKGGQHANLNRDVDNDVELSRNLYIA